MKCTQIPLLILILAAGSVAATEPFDLPGPIVITPPADTDLSPGETQQWTGVYTLTQADIDATFASAGAELATRGGLSDNRTGGIP